MIRVRRARTGARVLIAAAASVLAFALLAPAAHAEDEDGGLTLSETELGVSVKVLGPAAGTTQPPAGGGATIPSSPANSGGTKGSSGSNADPVVTSPAADTPLDGELAVAGGLYLGDLNASASPTLNPFEGSTELWFTVRNRSQETVDAAADFSLANVFGGRLSIARVEITALKPGESRVVSTVLPGSGQWPVVVGRATFTPPSVIDGQQTAAADRAVTVFVFPWLLLIGGVLLVVGLIILRVTRQIEAPAAQAVAVPA